VARHTRTLSLDGEARQVFAFGEGLVLETEVVIHQPIRAPIFRYTIDAVHYKFICSLDSFESDMGMRPIEPGTYRLRAVIPAQNFMPNVYSVNFAIVERDVGIHLFFVLNACKFKVAQPRDRLLKSDDNAVVHLENRFELEALVDREGTPPLRRSA
jgi:lipopolysaccharide transport system ATP-binding protein